MSIMKSMKGPKQILFGGSDWRGGSRSRLRFIFTCFLILASISVLSFVLAFYFYSGTLDLKKRSSQLIITHPKVPEVPEQQEPDEESEVVSCQFPRLDPLDPTVMKYIKPPTEPLDCAKKYGRPILFTTDFDSNLVQLEDPAKHGLTNCCYKPFTPVGGDFDGVGVSEICYPIVANLTPIQPLHDFIIVHCNSSATTRETIDMFNFVHDKLDRRLTGEQCQQDTNQSRKTPKKPELNIVLIGMDSMSHMHLLRAMPQTSSYLRKVSAIGMQGYTKVGDGTFPNVVAGQMGIHENELKAADGCWKRSPEFGYFDECPFIWKNFSRAGYVTSFAEDEQRTSIFNGWESGFLRQPTDYYLRPFVVRLGNELGHTSTGSHSVNLCTGPTLEFKVLLDYVTRLAVRMSQPSVDRKYFSFLWSTSIAHDSIEKSYHGDQPLLNFLEWFVEDPRRRADTALILLSDHGWPYGEEHVTVQPSIERRMPILYFLFPEWFKVKYSSAVRNLKINSERLTTPFDFHETLLDLVDPEKYISNEALQTHRHAKLNASNHTLWPRGISLFTRVPSDRSCPDAGIAPEFCVCNFLRMQNIPNPDTNPSVRSAMQVIVSNLNGMLAENPRCAQLELATILKAQQGSAHRANMDVNVKKASQLVVTFEVLPSNARFEATVVKNTMADDGDFDWAMSGLPSRLNRYGNQSRCVDASKPKLKNYCFCL